MLLSGFIANSKTLDNTISSYFAETNMADMWLYVNGIDIEDEEFLSNNNVKFDKRLYLETNAKFDDLQIQNNAKIYISDGVVSSPYVEYGKDEAGFGCFIDKNVAKNKNIRIGIDYVNFTLNYYGYDFDFKFLVTDYMSLDECADTYSAWPIFIGEKTFLQEFNQKLAVLGVPALESVDGLPYNQLLLKTEDVDSTKTLVNNYFSSKEENNLVMILNRDQIESVVLLNSEIEQSKKMIYVFPIIFLIVSVLVILTTIDQLILQEKTKIGTLKSIGVPDRKILNHYSKFGAVLCFIGAIVGVILGVLVIPSVMFVKYNLVYSIPGDFIKLQVPFGWVILVLALIVLLGYIVSLCVCHNILHKKPVECLRHDININVNLKGKKKKSKLPMPIKMAARNIKVKPIRTIMAMIGIAGCVALLLSGFGITDTLNHGIDGDFGEHFKYDITTTYTSDTFLSDLESGLDGFEFYEKNDKSYADISFSDKVKNAYIYQIAPDSKLTDIKLKDDEVCISKAIAKDLNANIGDTINASVGGKTVKLMVSKMIETSAINGIFVAKDLGFNERYITRGVFIKCKDVTDEKVAFVNSINGTDGAYSMDKVKDNINNQLSSINLITATLKTFAILLAVVVLFNLIFLIISERIREIATLKVIGVNIFTVTLTIFFEILFMGILGTAVGMLCGFPVLVLLLTINKVEIINYIYYLSPVSFVLTALIVVATIAVVTLLCLVKVKKVNMIESLKSVE